MNVRRFAGIDVSAKELAVTYRDARKNKKSASFENNATGHAKLTRFLTKHRGPVRICLEATGIYSLDVALALQAHRRIEVMVANPKAARHFAHACMKRAKTDRVDSDLLLEFAIRMPFEEWTPPADEALQLRTFARRIYAHTKTLTAEKNRLHAAQASQTTPPGVQDDIHASIEFVGQRIQHLTQQALQVVRTHSSLDEKFKLLLSIPGLAETSAVRILPELLVLPDDMTAKQLVAHSGLDPRPYDSGTSVKRKTIISKVGNKRLRAALYMPAITAIRVEPHVRAFRDHLVSKGLRPIQAAAAVMRKLLHAIHGMFASGQTWDGSRFYQIHAGSSA